MKKTNFLIAAVLGIIMPFIGIFAGLQISSTLGNVLAFPIILLSFITQIPFGMWHPSMFILAFALSIAEWD